MELTELPPDVLSLVTSWLHYPTAFLRTCKVTAAIQRDHRAWMLWMLRRLQGPVAVLAHLPTNSTFVALDHVQQVGPLFACWGSVLRVVACLLRISTLCGWSRAHVKLSAWLLVFLNWSRSWYWLDQ